MTTFAPETDRSGATATPVAGPTPEAVVEDDKQATPSVMKALQLLDAFRGAAGGVLGVSEIARRAGVPKSTAFRLLTHLEHGGYVERIGRDYCLGRHLFELGNSVPLCRPRGLRDVAAPHLGQLLVRTQRLVNLAVLEGTEVVYLEKIHGHDAVQVASTVGGRMPASCSALGKAMLAFSGRDAIRAVLDGGLVRRTRYSVADPARFLQELSRVHADGVAFDREEIQLGLVCAAVPVLDAAGRAVAAISVSGPATRFNPATVVAEVRSAAEAIGRDYRG
ncbi:IclR family transcriptional regulator [Nocardioides marmotae]|uniref:IclR family transcriptional regulator n=1 Tax=Nocardioides marmotae TaxID=2663857 RepID=UPI0012B521A8|nr:IclR family transcriptional regulator [Nocardioides marmotae]MBC9735196.1 IclR family transcriptional regulator [Nocardioides marmotae]MTB86296.1 helix-turn-helix domain-containing protein [Nocardioides marmotae]